MTNTSSSKYRYVLLATVSAVALNINIERGVSAADLTDVDPICGVDRWLSVEGQYLLFQGDGPRIYGLSPEPEYGWGGAAEIGIRECEGFSGVARVRYGRSNREREGTSISSSSSSGSDASYQESHLIADLEIGRDVGLGSMDENDSTVRVHAGLRFAYFEGEFDGSYYSSGFMDAKHKFMGVGPRIGVDANIPFGNNAAVDLRAAGAVLFGTRKVDGSYYSSYTSGSFSRKDSGVIVPNVEASAALTYLLGENANIAVGYRVDHYWNVLDMNAFPGPSREADRTMHGPFIRITVGGQN